MKHWFFHILAIACVVLLIDFVLTFFGPHFLRFGNDHRVYGVDYENWSMYVFYRNDLTLNDAQKGAFFPARHSRFHEFEFARFRLVWGEDCFFPGPVGRAKSPPFSGYDFYQAAAVGVPTILAGPILVAVPALVWTRNFRRRGQQSAGRCPACGYDLRASPDRCPECGRPVHLSAATPPRYTIGL